MPDDGNGPKAVILFPPGPGWLSIRNIATDTARVEVRRLILRYLDGDRNFMANRFGANRFTIRATDSTFEVDVLTEDNEKRFIVLAVSEA